MNLRSLSSLTTLLCLLGLAATAHATTVPGTLMYEGRILDANRRPVTTPIVLRFSFWKDVDWITTDTASGSINAASSTYGGWSEIQTITPTGNGIVNVQLGNETALPQIDYALHKFLQVEVKSDGQPDTDYQLLDPTGDVGADATDRQPIGSVAYAMNAATLDNRTTGTESGNILVLGPQGNIGIAQMGSGTNLLNFSINASQTAADAVLTFGNEAGPESLKFNNTTRRFEFSADVSVAGDLTVTGTMSGSMLHAHNRLESSGSLVVNGAANFGGTMTLGGVTYSFPMRDGTASGRVLATNGAGQLTWTRPFIFALKTEDETITNSEVLQDDDHLFFPVGANEQWEFEMHLVGNSSTSRDFRFAATAPAGSTCLISASDVEGATSGATTTCGEAIEKIAGNGRDVPYLMHGFISTGMTAGTVRLQWTQDNSGSSDSIIRAFSSLTARRIQ